MTKRLAFMLAVALGAGGACAGSGAARVDYASTVTVRSPELVTIEDDVYVLADADEPVFYADDYYWLYRQDRWYRSRSYDRGWVFVSAPSPRLRRIHEPTAYIRYRTRTQEARNVPRGARDPWRDEYERPDAPSTLPPHQQPPLQPTQPQHPAQPYPRPPQQEPVPPASDHHIDTQAPRAPAPPPRVIHNEPIVPGTHLRTKPTPPGQDVRPTTPPGQDVRPTTPPGQDVRPTTPPGQDVRPVPPGHDNRPATPPGQDRAKPQPPAGGTNVHPPGPPARHDVRTPDKDRGKSHDHGGNPPERTKPGQAERDKPTPPPAQVDREKPATPTQAERDKRERAKPTPPPARVDKERGNDKAANESRGDKRKEEKTDKKDKKRDY